MQHLSLLLQGRALRLALFSLVCMALAGLAFAQSTAGGSIQGAVADQTGAGLAGVKITFTNRATGAAVQVTSSSAGAYSAGPLQPGNYSVRFEATGFKTTELTAKAEVGVASAASVQLQPGQASELVQGPEEAAINTEQATVQSVLTASQIDGLPVNGRNLFDLAQLEAGVQVQEGSTLDPTKNGFSPISFQGRFGRTARIEVDGVDISDETVGATTQNIPASAIQQFNLSQSLLDLSTGLTSSGAVNVTTRSGSNGLHGEAFGLFRGNQVAAKLPGITTPTFQREQFGGRLGGELIKDKLFWFIDGERSKQDLTAAEPFSFPFSTLHTTLVQPFREVQADGRLDWINGRHGRAFYRFSFDQSSQVRPYGSASSLQGFKNQNRTPSHVFGYDLTTGEYTHSFRFEYLKFRNAIVDSTGNIPAGINNPIPGLGINIGASVAGNCQLSGGGAYCAGPNSLAPQTTLQSNLEGKYDGTRVWGSHIIRYGATFNHILGGVSATFLSYPQVGTTTTCPPSGSVCNNGDPTAYPAESVLLGNGIGFSNPFSAFGEPGGRLGPDNRFEAYVGDGWKIRKNVTITYGLHYVRDTGRVDSNLGPEPALNLWQPGLGAQVRTPNTNFAPQFGFAWDSGGNGKTVIRGGAGQFFENSIWNNVLFDSPARLKTGIFSYTPQVCSQGVPSSFAWPTNPGNAGASIAGGAGVVVAGVDQVQPTFCGGTISAVANQILALSNAFKAAAAANVGPKANGNYIGIAKNAANVNGFDLFDPNYRTPRSWQMNFGFQHQIRPGTVLSLDLIRNVGEHFLLAIDKNHSGAARSYNLANALAARDSAQLANGCAAGFDQASCMVLRLGQAGAQLAYSTAGLDSNIAVTGGAPCGFCAFPGITPNGQNNAGIGGNGSLGALDILEPIGRSVYNGLQIRLVHNVQHPSRLVKAANFQFSYSFSKFVSQVQDQDFINLATDNDNPLRFTGPNALDRKHQFSLGGTFDLPFFTRLNMIGHFYSPLPQNLQLPELTNGGEIFATDWLGTGLGSGAAPEPVPGTQIGQFMRGTDASGLQRVISDYNTHFAGTLTPAGHCLVADGQCPGTGTVQVMSPADMSALGWVMPQLASVSPGTQNFPWLKSMDVKLSWPIKLRERVTIEPSASIFNVFNFSNAFLPGNLPLASLAAGGPNGTLAPNVVGGVTGANLTPFRAGFQSGTYALGAPRQLEFGLRIDF